MFFNFSSRARVWRCQTLKSRVPVHARQDEVPGWDQREFSKTRGLFTGAGGANGEVIEGATQKGIGEAHVCDGDIVEPTNLNRQKFFKRDLYKNKALCLCRNLSKRGFLGTKLFAYPCWFQVLDLGRINPDFVVCSVDMTFPETRLEVARECHRRRIPVIFLAVSTDADWGYVFVQEPRKACWGCLFKPEMDLVSTGKAETTKHCPGVPATGDILKRLAG